MQEEGEEFFVLISHTLASSCTSRLTGPISLLFLSTPRFTFAVWPFYVIQWRNSIGTFRFLSRYIGAKNTHNYGQLNVERIGKCMLRMNVIHNQEESLASSSTKQYIFIACRALRSTYYEESTPVEARKHYAKLILLVPFY